MAERSLPPTVQRTPSPPAWPLPSPTETTTDDTASVATVQTEPVPPFERPELPVQRTIDEPVALPVLQPILADRSPVVQDRSSAATPAEAPAIQARAIDRHPGRLQQLTASVQRTTVAPQQLEMPTAPVPAINPLSSAPAPQHRATQLIAPATPVVVQRTASPPPPEPIPDSTVVQLAEEPAPIPSTPPASPSNTNTTSNNTDIDGLARRLYDPIARRLRAELRVDRERAGTLVDRPW